MTTPVLEPAIFVEDLWGSEDDLGTSLDAVFDDTHAQALSIGYYLNNGLILSIGPAHVISQAEGRYNYSTSLPQDDRSAALIGRAIQRTLDAEATMNFIISHWGDDERDHWNGTISALFTRNGLFLFKEDPWEAVNTNPLDKYLDAAAMQVCTVVVRPVQSAHQRLIRANAIVDDFKIYLENQKEGLQILEAQGVARLKHLDAARVAQSL
jgi:hypothetical protein